MTDYTHIALHFTVILDVPEDVEDPLNFAFEELERLHKAGYLMDVLDYDDCDYF